MKRENKTGSVYKRKDYKANPWMAVAPTKYDINGKVKPIIIGHYPTKTSAKEALAEYLSTPTDYPNMTFSEAYRKWSETAFRNISKSSVTGYEASYKKCEYLYNMRLKDIKTEHIQTTIDSFSNQSHSALTKLKMFIGQIMKFGIQEDIINKNYTDFVVLPKATKQEKEFFTDIEIDKIRKSIGKIPYAEYIYCMIYTGFRIGEFLSLTQFSYDRENKTLTGGSKTEAGINRIVPLHSSIVPLIEKQITLNGQNLFCNLDTKNKMGTDWFRKNIYYNTLEQIGVRKLNPHCTRHTFATLLSNSGVKPEAAQKILGHSQYSTTANVYIHKSTDELLKEIEKVI